MRWKETSHTCSHCHSLLLTYMMPPNLVIDAHGCANSRKGHRGRRKGLLPPIFPLFIAALKAILALRDGRHSSKQALSVRSLRHLFPLNANFYCPLVLHFFWPLPVLAHPPPQGEWPACSIPPPLQFRSCSRQIVLQNSTLLLLHRPQLELTSVGGI